MTGGTEHGRNKAVGQQQTPAMMLSHESQGSDTGQVEAGQTSDKCERYDDFFSTVNHKAIARNGSNGPFSVASRLAQLTIVGWKRIRRRGSF